MRVQSSGRTTVQATVIEYKSLANQCIHWDVMVIMFVVCLSVFSLSLKMTAQIDNIGAFVFDSSAYSSVKRGCCTLRIPDGTTQKDIYGTGSFSYPFRVKHSVERKQKHNIK